MPGGEPYGLLVVDHEVRHRPTPDAPGDDINALAQLAGVVAAAFVPTALAAAPALLQVEDFGDLAMVSELGDPFRMESRLSRLWDRLLAYCQEAQRDGRPLTEDQDVRDVLAEIYIKTEVSRLFGLRNFWLAYANQPRSYEGPQLSLYRKMAGLWMTGAILEAIGPAALTSDLSRARRYAPTMPPGVVVISSFRTPFDCRSHKGVRHAPPTRRDAVPGPVRPGRPDAAGPAPRPPARAERARVRARPPPRRPAARRGGDRVPAAGPGG